MPDRATTIIITGTDPTSKSGGIGFALPGYLAAIEFAAIPAITIPTYHPAKPGGAWRIWLAAFPQLARSALTARKTGHRVVVYSHPGAGVSLIREMFIAGFARMLGAVCIVQIHAPEVIQYLGHPSGKLFFRLVIAPASALAVLTPWWENTLTQAGIGKQIFVIPNPLPVQWENMARSVNIKHLASKPLTILALTRIIPGKGIDLLIEAMPMIPMEIVLIIAGDGAQMDRIRQRIDELAITPRVRLTGWVSGKEKQRLFEQSDIFCLPSSLDSFGMGYLEAMANGLPVIALNWGPIPDVIPDQRCGILIKEKSPRLLADAIIRLQDPKLRKSMGGAAKRWVIENFSARVVAVNIQKMLQAIQ